MLELDKLWTVNSTLFMFDFNLNSDMITKTVKYPKRRPVTYRLFPLVVIKVRVVQVVHRPVLMKVPLTVFTLLPYGLCLENKPPPKKVLHRLGEVILLNKLLK